MTRHDIANFVNCVRSMDAQKKIAQISLEPPLTLLSFPYRFLFHQPDVRKNMAVYCKALVNKFILLATCMFPGRHYQLK